MESVGELAAKLISGGLLWEGIKALGKFLFSRWNEKKAAQLKLLQADVERLITLVEPLSKLALSYYGRSSAVASDTARAIRIDMKSFAQVFGQVNERLVQLKRPKLDQQLLISFRKALTSELDVTRTQPLSADDPVVEEIFDSTHALRSALSALRYKLV